MSGNALGCLTFSLGFEKNYNCLCLDVTQIDPDQLKPRRAIRAMFRQVSSEQDYILNVQFMLSKQGRIQTFKKGSSTLELQLQHSCRLKTKKRGHHLLTIATPHHRYPQFRTTYCSY